MRTACKLCCAKLDELNVQYLKQKATFFIWADISEFRILITYVTISYNSKIIVTSRHDMPIIHFCGRSLFKSPLYCVNIHAYVNMLIRKGAKYTLVQSLKA